MRACLETQTTERLEERMGTRSLSASWPMPEIERKALRCNETTAEIRQTWPSVLERLVCPPKQRERVVVQAIVDGDGKAEAMGRKRWRSI
jgi:hypothetical protein